MQYRVLSVEEAIPLLLDRNVSPVVACDTEFGEDGMHGLSLAGGTPETGLFGCFWSFDPRYQQAPWDSLLRRVIEPIVSDPERVFVMHPLSVDMKQIRKRGVTDAMVKCKLEDTIAQAYIFDDNLPHGLKDLAYCILLKTTATSYTKTQREIEGIRKGSKEVIKALKDQVWETYTEHRQKSTEIEVELDPSWPGWKRLAMSLPPGMNKTTPKTWSCGGKNGCGASNAVDDSKLSLHSLQDEQQCVCGRTRRVKLGLLSFIDPIITPVVQREFDAKAYDRFALYGAEDAIYTLMLRYHFHPTFSAQQLEHLDLETRITYPVVTKMEERGLKIDIDLLEGIRVAMTISIEALTAKVLRLWTLPADTVPFNPGSPDQVASRVWLDWALTPPAWAKDKQGGIKKKHARAKDGLCSADKEVLAALAEKHAGTYYGEAILCLTELRRWNKLLGTYVEPILEKSRRDPDGRIHSSFWPTGARSGRFSSSNPNVENIPRPFTMPTLEIDWAIEIFAGHEVLDEPPLGFVVVRDKQKHIIAWRIQSLREIFIVPSGWQYVSADLSQVENRLTAFESRDNTMLDLYRRWDCADCDSTGVCNTILHDCPACGANEGKRDKSHPDQPVLHGFVHGKDIHSATAAYLKFFDKYGEDGRQQAKPVNHAATYGMGANTFSRREGVTIKEGAASLTEWHRTYPAVRGSLDDAVPGTLHFRVAEDIRTYGRVEMFDGHVRTFKAQRALMSSGNFRSYEWEGTIREGVNVKMQGGTGVLMKRAMLAIDAQIIARGWVGRVHLVNQVHDELLYEVEDELVEEFYGVLCYELEHAAPEIDVPILAEGGKGVTWGQAH